MGRKVELKKETLTLKEEGIEGFLERIVTPHGTSGKADVPKKYMNRIVYVIITKTKGRKKQTPTNTTQES
jgi:putative transposon-encoded protein